MYITDNIPFAAAPARTAIIGAGIAGLTLALCLRKQGGEPILFETRSRDALISEGAFITLAPNAMNGLALLGLADAVAALGIDTIGLAFIDERGRDLGFADQRDHAAVFGAPSVTISRGALMGVLASACERAGIAIHYECRLRRIADLDDHVRVEWQEGQSCDVAWLAACDGLRSQTRALFFPEFPKPSFTGLIGTGGIAKVDHVAPTDGVMRMVFGHIGFFGYLKDKDGPVYWFNSYPAKKPHEGNQPSSYVGRLRALHREDPPFIDEILAGVPEVMRDYPVFSMPALPTWHRGLVVLVGDAAHAVGPHAGQGAAMAIEDAVVLAACLGAGGDIPAAFARFEALRRPRVEAVVKLTERNSSQKRATSRFDLLIRRIILRLFIPIGIKAGRKLFDYRVYDEALRLTSATIEGRT